MGFLSSRPRQPGLCREFPSKKKRKEKRKEKKKYILRAGEVAQQFRAVAAPAEDLAPFLAPTSSGLQ